METSALGCDYSTHKVHLAKVGRRDGRDEVLALRQVDLDRLRMSEQVVSIRGALELLGPSNLLVVEQPFVSWGNERPNNFGSDLLLARMGGVMVACGVSAGLEVQELTASSWRSLVGVKGRKRDDLKKAAIGMCRIQFGHETSDDNEAESILMAYAALLVVRERELANRVKR